MHVSIVIAKFVLQETESEKMRELTSEVDKMKKKMEDSKEALEKKRKEILQMKVSIFVLSAAIFVPYVCNYSTVKRVYITSSNFCQLGKISFKRNVCYLNICYLKRMKNIKNLVEIFVNAVLIHKFCQNLDVVHKTH